ncbi:dihydroxyacetone kinase subunit DhaL [Sporolactobacillus kofuensis]|uniref:Dihydroxyacetone kinase subunit DhaL n=1 Tax=Sporolactobacillus kofuensis TaxID=269672 RepID=A0ABW1WD94_9BACL|nr:dihydroxyacetone kinase subunit DhaL [Sporolactobacillus kofuensis]MCO7175468.1 dihydroxyacetone kinase subunit DhaL [Sporolactobacillus kofuensis]
MELTINQAKKWIILWTDYVKNNVELLNEIDTAIGDGDHGTNLNRGTQATKKALEEEDPQTMPLVFRTVALTLVSTIGGASGALYGTAFLTMARLVKDGETRLEVLLVEATKAMKKRGKSDVGMKTLIDLWDPASKAFAEHKLTKEYINDCVEKTKNMKAKKGRSSYLRERSIGHVDPVAKSSSYLYIALLEVID